MAKGSGGGGRSSRAGKASVKRDIRNWKSQIRDGQRLLNGKTLSATARSNWERAIVDLQRRVSDAERSL